jgi:hypothetical protein
VKKAFRIIGYSLVVLLFLSAIIVGMTQTALFKEWVRQFAVREAAQHLNGELRIGSVSGTFVTGVTLKDVEWWYDQMRVIHIESLDLTIAPARFIHNEILVQNLVIMNPDIRLVKDADGLLNVSQIVKKKESTDIAHSDTVESGQSEPWIYRLNNLEILGGSFSYSNESKTVRTKRDYPVSFPRVDFDDLRLDNIYLTMSAISDGHNHSVDIRSLNFTLEDPVFTASHFSLQAAFSDRRTQINRMRLITDRSNVNITGGISDYNLLGKNEGRIEEKKIDFTIYANRLHFDDLKMFIPALWFLEGDAALDMAAGGSLDEVNIEKIDVKLGRTELALIGTLTDVTDKDRLFIDASFTDSRLDPIDVNSLLPHFTIPDYSHLGVLDVSATYSGKPKDFSARLDLHTSAGLYSAHVDLDLTGPQLAYDGSVVTRNADITALMQNDYYPYDLTGRIFLEGKGTNLNEIIANAQLIIDNMKIAHLSFDSLATNVYARHHDIRLISSGYFENSKFTIDAASSVTDVDTAPFEVRLSFESLDLARVMLDSTYNSDLTFSLIGEGTGLRPASILGDITMALEPSRFRDYTVVGEPVYVSLAEIDTSFRELNIRSEIMDVYLAGEFDIPTIVGITFDHVRQLLASVRDDVHGIVTGEVLARTEFINTLEIQNPLDTVYDIDIKNVDAVAIFLGRDAFEVEVEGKLYGYFRAMDNMLHLGGDIEIDHFLYLSDENRLLLDKITGWYNIDNNYTARGLEGIYAVLDVSASGIYTQSLTMNQAQIRADIKQTDWTVYSKAVIDTVLGYEVDAIARFDSVSLTTDISELAIRYGDIDFSNRDTLQMRYDYTGIRFESFTLYHNDLSTVDISGLYAFSDEHEIEFTLAHIDLEEIHRILSPDAIQRRQPLFSGDINIVGTIGGTTDSLLSQLDVRIEDVTYGDLAFGVINGTFGYNAQRIDFIADVTKTDDPTQTAFKINGYMPFDPFAGGGDRIPDGPLNVHIYSEGFDLSIIDPFLRDIRNFSARMTSDVMIAGTVEDPVYEGDLEITDGQFVFVPNNVTYHFNGKVEPRQNELVLSHLHLQNRRRDLPEGRMNFSGSVRTRGLNIRYFDLHADGQLLVLRTASRRPGDMFYGDLTVATGTGGMHLSGSLEESLLTGTLLIRSANLTFPPARTTAYDRTGSIVNYIVIDDPEEAMATLTPLEMFFRDIAQSQGTGSAQQQSGSTFIDGLDYDIMLQTDGRVEMTMIFNQATAEELVARIETAGLRLYRDDLTGMRLIGNVNIVEPSAYSFYRKFDARGRLSFVGAPDNPELNISATYTGQRMPVQPVAAGPDQLAPTTGGMPEPVVVRLHITGDRYEPKLNINLIVNNEEWEGDVETDAISFILTGRFQTELGSGDRQAISADFGRGIPATFMSGVATSLLSNLFTEFLRNEVRFIRAAEIVYYGGNIMDTAELRISGELRNFYWTIGGRVFNDIGNTNFSFQIPMGPVFNSDRWTNLFLELERRSQSIEYFEDQRPVNAARLYYSISF